MFSILALLPGAALAQRSNLEQQCTANIGGNAATTKIHGDTTLQVRWSLDGGGALELFANLADQASEVMLPDEVEGDFLYATDPDLLAALRAGRLPPWSVLWLLNQPAR